MTFVHTENQICGMFSYFFILRKGGNHSMLISASGYRQVALHINKHEQFTPRRRELLVCLFSYV